MAQTLGLPEVAAYWNAVLLMNQAQKTHVARRVLDQVDPGEQVLVVGAAFKDGTSDVRNSQNIAIVRSLLEQGVHCTLYDEYAESSQVRSELERLGPVEGGNLTFSKDNLLESARGCRCVLILQSFETLVSLDFPSLCAEMT